MLEVRPAVISKLEFEVTGKISGLKQDYIFYQVEDGHSFFCLTAKSIFKRLGNLKQT